MKDPYHELQTLLNAVRHRIRQGGETLTAGNDVDLSELSDEVMKVCDSVRIEFALIESSKIDRATFSSELNTIIADLDDLKEKVIRQPAAKGGKTDLEVGESD